jgi:hypothetical protein
MTASAGHRAAARTSSWAALGSAGAVLLVGDVGATNARFGLVSPEGQLLNFRVFASRNYPTIDDAITTALSQTGAAVFSTFAVMIGGILPWAFSPLLFHNEMSVLLIFLMGTNMVAGCLILPSFIAWWRPNFIRRYLHPHPVRPTADRAVVS